MKYSIMFPTTYIYISGPQLQFFSPIANGIQWTVQYFGKNAAKKEPLQ